MKRPLLVKLTTVITAIAALAAPAVSYGQDTESRIIGTIPGLPPGSMEIKPHENITTPIPYRVPQPGDGLYDAAHELEIKEHRNNTIRLYERGVFVGYSQITGVRSSTEPNARQFEDGTYKVNPKLPPDAVELDASAHPDPSHYWHSPPQARPANIPADYVLTRVFQGKKFIGWMYLRKEFVADLHKPKAATKRPSK